MDAMSGFLGYLLSPLSMVNLQGMLHVSGELFTSANLFFWFLVLILLRFMLPDVVLWLTTLYYPKALEVRPGPGLPHEPLVSVVIAGRNVGDGIARTIHSALECGYRRLEVVFVDDFSTDDSVAQARSLEATGRVRVFQASHHNGKPSSLNIGLTMARGEFVFILDADCELQPVIIEHLLAPFGDERVGAVAANLRVRNATQNVVTRFQECEYALNVSVSRSWHARLGLLPILPGAGSMFRAATLRQMKGYDTGLGDDTDMTLRLRKGGWKLRFSLEAIVWTDVPDNYFWLMRQRARWSRNMVKIRMHKHGDLIRAWRFGMLNALLFADNLLFRVLTPILAFSGLIYYGLTAPLESPMLLTGMYWATVLFLLVKMLIAHDIAHTPRLKMLWLVPLYPFYRLPIHTIELLAILRELLRIRLWHPYVPKRIWARTPHW